MKLDIQIYWHDEELKGETIELDEEKFEPLTEEEKEAAIETIIRDHINKHLAVRWEVKE